MNVRMESDSMGKIAVPADKYWGAQTERSRRNFPIGVGQEPMPSEVITALALIKKAAALVNRELLPKRMTQEKRDLIVRAADEILAGKLWEHFPLVVFQTGSGTQTNMNVNEVIAGWGNELAGRKLLHPNDDVNMSQSSNDTFPSAMRIAAVIALEDRLQPAVDRMILALKTLEAENEDVIKSGRTHLQDAVPIRFSQEISGWRAGLERDEEMLRVLMGSLGELALGGTAVGTGLNAPQDFDTSAARVVSVLTGKAFIPATNKFHALTSLDELTAVHGVVKALACDSMKMANDIRLLASGPRCGFSEISIPALEPGSSIMPGKVNPTQCEQLSMVAVQVMGNDAAVSLAASQGHLELNVYLPVCIYNFLQSVRLLSESLDSFRERCICGLKADRTRMKEYLDRSLMLVTALNPVIGYEKAASVAELAYREGLDLRTACLQLGYLGEQELDARLNAEKMV